MLPPTLVAPRAKPHVSVARLTDFWYIACLAKDLVARKPKAVTLAGVPLVLFRNDKNEVGALLDRCPHRNVRLSTGRVVGENLACRYHGWQFDRAGACQLIPALTSTFDPKDRGVTAYPAREQDGFIWVYTNPDRAPTVEPFRFPFLGDRRYSHAYREVEAGGTMHATIENALDVPHTAFLHAKLFRGGGTANDITAHVRRWGDRVEAEYVGEPRPSGLAARILAPSGGMVTHFDRFFLPSIAQVEYALGKDKDTHFVVSSAMTPVSDFVTKLFAVVSFKIRYIPHWLVRLFIEPIAQRIFAQDAEVLAEQTANVAQFGGEQFVSSEIDLLGPHIWRLMREAERGETKLIEAPIAEKQVVLRV